jgi:hypothetical protein
MNEVKKAERAALGESQRGSATGQQAIIRIDHNPGSLGRRH